MFVAALAVTCAVLAVATWSLWWPGTVDLPTTQHDTMALRTNAAETDEDNTKPRHDARDLPMSLPMGKGPVGQLVPGPGSLVHVHPNDQPLTGEPADLPLPPHADQLTGLTRQAAGYVEHIATRRVPDATLETVADHYDQAARDAGFQSVGSTSHTPQTGRLHRLYARRVADDLPGAQSTLTVRLKAERGGSVHVLLWLQRPKSD